MHKGGRGKFIFFVNKKIAMPIIFQLCSFCGGYDVSLTVERIFLADFTPFLVKVGF